MSYQTLQLEQRNDYLVIQLDNGKVNAINTQLASDLVDAFTFAEKEEAVKGVILTGRPHCFSAGLDIISLASGGLEGLKDFWGAYLKAVQLMVRFPKPFICATTGYAPAGATILVCTADYRIMGRGEKHKIGMHEIPLSLQIPEMLIKVFAHWIGDGKANEYVLNGRLMLADEAVSIGLINEACEVDEVLERAEKRMQKWLRTYHKVFNKTKLILRRSFIEKVDMDIDEMIVDILSDWGDPMMTQKMMEFMTSLKKSK